MDLKTIALAASLAFAAACSHAAPGASIPRSAELIDDAGKPRALAEVVGQSPYTVLVFFSATCPVQEAHDSRLVELANAYKAKGVQVLAVDSEADASPERDAAEAKRRGYPFPIWIDRGASLANTLGADWATYTVVVDREGNVHYRGGVDSDRAKLHDDAKPYVKDAIDDLLGGHEPRLPHGKSFGCMLRKS